MKVVNCSVSNFASYKDLTFEFSYQGLCLISGPTGSGKSTLCDIIPWCLWGHTAKNGAVDDVRAWNAEGPTKGLIVLEWGSTLMTICRQRVPNDLYYVLNGKGPVRGKDLNDTQRLINQELGLTLDTYLAASYFHEFSQTAAFFTATAKQRRAIVEQFADLSLATKVATGVADYRKLITAEIVSAVQSIKSLVQQHDLLTRAHKPALDRKTAWEADQAGKIQRLKIKVQSFDVDKALKISEAKENVENFEADRIRSIQRLEGEKTDLKRQIKPAKYYMDKLAEAEAAIKACGDDKCPTCGNVKSAAQKLVAVKEGHKIERAMQENVLLENRVAAIDNEIRRHNKALNPFTSQVEREAAAENVYTEQLEKAQAETNPHTAMVKGLHEDIADTEAKKHSAEALLRDLNEELADLDLLIKVTADFRAALVTGAVQNLETGTNRLLTDFFDAEIRVRFELGEADKIEVSIYKDGNLCSYSQLSKGQRQLLRLCFAVSVMNTVANFHQSHFDTLFFDEALDGLDDTLKAKSYRLFEHLALSHSSVFVVEHNSGLKTLFNTGYSVQLSNGTSDISSCDSYSRTGVSGGAA